MTRRKNPADLAKVAATKKEPAVVDENVKQESGEPPLVKFFRGLENEIVEAHIANVTRVDFDPPRPLPEGASIGDGTHSFNGVKWQFGVAHDAVLFAELIPAEGAEPDVGAALAILPGPVGSSMAEAAVLSASSEGERSMADDLKDIASSVGASPPGSVALEGMDKLLALSAEADQHPQGKQGCMTFDPPRALGDLVALLPDGVWRAHPDALWRFTVEDGAITRAIRRDMSHLIDETEEVRDLAA